MNLLAFAIIATATTAIPGGATSVSYTDPNLLVIENNIVGHTNAERARHGLPPLQVDTQLMYGARKHANWMALRNAMQHTMAVVAENIAAGQSSSSEVVRDWMNSPGHRANILNSSYRRIGVAAYRGRDGQIYWCQQFLQ